MLRDYWENVCATICTPESDEADVIGVLVDDYEKNTIQ